MTIQYLRRPVCERFRRSGLYSAVIDALDINHAPMSVVFVSDKPFALPRLGDFKEFSDNMLIPLDDHDFTPLGDTAYSVWSLAPCDQGNYSLSHVGDNLTGRRDRESVGSLVLRALSVIENDSTLGLDRINKGCANFVILS